MVTRNIAMLTMHSCPIGQPGEGDVGGMNVYAAQVARELGRAGYFVDLYTRRDRAHSQPVVEIAPSVRVAHVDAGPIDEPKRGLADYVPAFVQAVDEFRREHRMSYDLVHSHYWLSGAAARELSAEWGVPHVAMFHTTALTKMLARVGEQEPERRVDAEGKIMADANAVIVSTHEERAAMSRLYGTDTAKIRVLPAGVDLALFRPMDKDDARRSLGLQDRNVVLSVGRAEPLKGFDILLMSMASLDDSLGTTIVIVGGDVESDPEMARLRDLSRTLGLEDRVIFTGAVSQDCLSMYYNAADVFVLPSYYESFGLVALEAMACGVPVIAGRVGGPRSFIKSGVTGYLIDRTCPEPFAQKLEVLLHNPALRKGMGQAARSHAETMSWEKVAQRTIDVYDSVAPAPQATAIAAR